MFATTCLWSSLLLLLSIVDQSSAFVPSSPRIKYYRQRSTTQRLVQARSHQVPSTLLDLTARSALAYQDIISAPLYFTSPDEDLLVPAFDKGDIAVEGQLPPYPTVRVRVNDSFDLNLLLGTGCRGFVLRPEIFRLIHRIESFELGGRRFGPLPATVEDSPALPISLDGIIGQSFLRQFAAFEMDFKDGVVSFFVNEWAIPNRSDNLVTRGSLTMLDELGLYASKVYLDGQGPVCMLVDTGASKSLLDWKGVLQLGLSRHSAEVTKIPMPCGALGSANMGTQLTHRLGVSSTIGFEQSRGLLLAGSRLEIDIGPMPYLDNFASRHVGGVLGIDALLRCGAVRISCMEKTIEMYQ